MLILVSLLFVCLIGLIIMRKLLKVFKFLFIFLRVVGLVVGL